MYYEAIPHSRRQVGDAAEAARLIHDGQARDFDALVWTCDKGELCCVADGGLNNPWAEVAVLNLTTNRQIESLTFAWIDSLEDKVSHLKQCETGDFEMGKDANCPLDGAGQDRLVGFTCGCCGDWFKSTIAEQRQYDQDNGYGFCPRCVPLCR